MADRDRDVLRLYAEHRVRDQASRFYESRRDEYVSAHRQSLVLKAVLLLLGGAAGALAGINLWGERALWSVLAAALPALSTALMAYDGLFAFDRVAKLYRDAIDSLTLVEAPTENEVIEDASALGRYINQVEAIFQREQGQWGQLTSDIKSVEPPASQD